MLPNLSKAFIGFFKRQALILKFRPSVTLETPLSATVDLYLLQNLYYQLIYFSSFLSFFSFFFLLYIVWIF